MCINLYLTQHNRQYGEGVVSKKIWQDSLVDSVD